MNDITQPANATEARAALDAKMANSEWSSRYLQGGAAERQEFTDLTTKISNGGADAVSAAMGGDLPDLATSTDRLMASTAGWLRDRGFPDKAIHETLSGTEPTVEDIQRARTWKTQAMRSAEFSKRYLAGEPDAVREMLAADAVLTIGSHAQALKSARGA